MDTEWFAVDRDGYVAVFETGEAGAMPVDAAGGEGSEDEFDPAVFAGRRSGWIYDADGHLESETDEHCVPYGDNPSLWGEVLMFVESIEPLRAEMGRSGGKEVPANGSAAVLWAALPVDVFRRLHDDGTCLHCRYHYEPDPEEVTDFREALFVYQHLHDNWISGPYGRTSLPAKPVHLDELPEETRRRLESCRFENVSFRDDSLIQPVELTECASWEGAWLSSDGESIHPFPGEEERYREYYDEFATDPEIQEKYRVDPPTVPAKPRPSRPTSTPAPSQNGGGFWASIRRLFGGGG
jgi:hypothetical protein